jgi:hypothetical protein
MTKINSNTNYSEEIKTKVKTNLQKSGYQVDVKCYWTHFDDLSKYYVELKYKDIVFEYNLFRDPNQMIVFWDKVNHISSDFRNLIEKNASKNSKVQQHLETDDINENDKNGISPFDIETSISKYTQHSETKDVVDLVGKIILKNEKPYEEIFKTIVEMVGEKNRALIEAREEELIAKYDRKTEISERNNRNLEYQLEFQKTTLIAEHNLEVFKLKSEYEALKLSKDNMKDEIDEETEHKIKMIELVAKNEIEIKSKELEKANKTISELKELISEKEKIIVDIKTNKSWWSR